MGLLKTLLSEWTRYLLDSCKRQESPGDDRTGALQKKRQKNREVWFVPGSFGNRDIITRNNIAIPEDRKLFCVGASADASTAEPQYRGYNPQQLKAAAEATLGRFNEAYVEIDDQRYSKGGGLTEVVTDPFQIQFVDGNPYEQDYHVTEGTATIVCAALVAYVEQPLTSGGHDITVYSRRNADNFQVHVIHNVRVG